MKINKEIKFNKVQKMQPMILKRKQKSKNIVHFNIIIINYSIMKNFNNNNNNHHNSQFF